MATINIQDSSDEPEPKPIPVPSPDIKDNEPATETGVEPTPEPEAADPALDATEEPAAEEPEAEPQDPDETDKAVDDSMKKDGDDALKAQDAAAERPVVMKTSPWERFKNVWVAWWASPKKRYGTLGTILLAIVVLMAVPLTRYDILGLVLKTDVTVNAIDSKTGAAVSGASVVLAGQKAQTDVNGKAVVHAPLGSKSLSVTKKYYTGSNNKALITLSSSHNHFKARLVAQGRQVQLKLVDKVSAKPLSGATIDVQGAKTKSDTKGLATVIIPADSTGQKASVSFDGYNALAVTIQPDGPVAKNTFALTPAGKLYFLSNLSGKLDVVKANLDGSDRQTVLAGTGNEDPRATSLLASRDWKYLALLSKRTGDTASVYLIDTTNGDKLTTVDQGNANFTLIGWSGDNFVYQVNRNDIKNWQSNQQALKSLNAANGQTLLLDQSQASGSSDSDYSQQQFLSPYIIDDQVVYAKNWYASYNNSSQLSSKQAELDTIGSNGSGHKTVKTFALASGTQTSQVYINLRLYEPSAIYIDFNDGNTDIFSVYEDGKVTADSTMTSDKFYQTTYPTYLQSPSGSQTFWTELRDGKNTLFVGDKDAKTPKQVASLSTYSPYGWYSDDYLLVSKDSSQLFIMPAAGGTPQKITDYYKPQIIYNGYGGGYGGL